jgi:peptide/nickel transport system substrate-binding protein
VKVDIRWQLLLASICAGLVVAILGFQVQTAGSCTTIVPATGDRLIEGMVGKPRYLNPLLSDDNPVDAQLVDLIFDGLTRYDSEGRLVPALATEWHFSEGGRAVTFHIRESVNWHDGQPLTAADVAFTYGLLQEESFPASQALKSMWQSVVISQTGDLELSFTLPQPYAPFLESTTRGILPAHILQGVHPVDIGGHRYNRAPIGTGPFMVTPGSDWQRTGSLRLSPNPLYWREGAALGGTEYRFYPDSQALAEAYANGNIHALTEIPSADLGTFALLDGLRLFTSGSQTYTQLLFNLGGEADSPLRRLEVRRALAYALDREALIDQTHSGQGLPLEGPFLPSTWAYDPALLTRYGYQPELAAQLLDEAGWRKPDGGSVRLNSNGDSLAIRLLTSADGLSEQMAHFIANAWTELGVSIEIVLEERVGLLSALEQGLFDAALVDVSTARDPDLYDFWSQEAIVRGQNYGGWNNRLASEALESARQVSTIEERRPYYQTFLQHFEADLPALTLFQHAQSFGIADSVHQVEIGPVVHPRDRYQTLSDWFLYYREVPIECPPDVAAG